MLVPGYTIYFRQGQAQISNIFVSAADLIIMSANIDTFSNFFELDLYSDGFFVAGRFHLNFYD